MDAHEPATTERLRVRARAFYDGISGRAQGAGRRTGQRQDGESLERGDGLEDRQQRMNNNYRLSEDQG